MAKDEVFTVKDAVHRLQLCLLEGIQDEDKLFAAGSLMSQDDYQDVVTERSIANLCGYPLCGNILPSDRPRKGRYRISLKEHKVYDLQETYMYCSTSCLINSRAFVSSLPEERSSALNPVKLNEVLSLFKGLSLEDLTEDLGKKYNLGMPALRIQEKTDIRASEVAFEEWIGPSNAVEGYVPQRNSSLKQQQRDKLDKGHKSKHAQMTPKKDGFFSEMDFTSTLILQDEYSMSKAPETTNTIFSEKSESRKGKMKQKSLKDHSAKSDEPVASVRHSILNKESPKTQRIPVKNEKLGDLSKEMNEKLVIRDSSSDPGRKALNMSVSNATTQFHDDKASALNATAVKSSLKSSTGKRGTRSVTWADEKTDGNKSNSLCEIRELEDKDDTCRRPSSTEIEVDEDSYRVVSAGACARALIEAAEAVASEDSDISNAMYEAGIIVLPPPKEVNESKAQGNFDMLDSEPSSLKWPMKPNSSDTDLFDSSDSWYDDPPEGFSLTLSTFATMYMSLFAWTSSCSLAYIYGQDESHHEEYSYINGREYPIRIIASDGRSLEIKQALAGCLARALPGLVTDLRLPVPLSTLEKEMDHLLDTMSFLDPLPPFRLKQWQLLVLLFLDALSICRVPALSTYMTGRRILLPKIFQSAQISAEEYESMKDVLIPLGRVPEFAMQSGA